MMLTVLSWLPLHLQTSQAVSLTERDVLMGLWQFIAWMLGAIGTGCAVVLGILWRWLFGKFKQQDAMELRLRSSIQAIVMPIESKVVDVSKDVQGLREALIRLHPDIELGG